MNNASRKNNQYLTTLIYRIKVHAKTLLVALGELAPCKLYRSFLGNALNGAKRYPTLALYEDFLINAAKKRKIQVDHTVEGDNFERSLDLGCGLAPKNPFQADKVYGIDFESDLAKNIVSANLSIDQIPFQDLFFSYVTAFDFIEHIPRVLCVSHDTRYPFICLMNEVYRVLKPGGFFFHVSPAFPSKYAFTDPTHVNIITEDTFPCYFSGNYAGARAYGFTGSFNLISQAWIRDLYIATIMQKPLSCFK